MRFVVIVLGDVGRSPRMQYHCESLVDAGHDVILLGYQGEAFAPTSPRLQVFRFENVRIAQRWIPRPVYFILRLFLLMGVLCKTLYTHCLHQGPVDFVLIQNPPALPLMMVASMYCYVKAFTQRQRRPGLIIDWHNLGWSMFPQGSLAQRISRAIEERLAPRVAHGHLTVTQAMKEYLATTMGITKNVGVLYDQPPDIFAPLSMDQQHEVLSGLHVPLCAACPQAWSHHLSPPQQTLLTEQTSAGTIRPRPGRPALITSSTSWTFDEDFGILLDALEILDQQLVDTNAKLLVVVTGKGPLRDQYEARISQTPWTHVAVATVWLPAATYPQLLACADVGISLHTSTSGLDLPMKILDLFGCAVPVLAYEYPTCHELVQPNINGRTFTTGHDLAAALQEVLEPLLLSGGQALGNHEYGVLKDYSENIKARQQRWGPNWTENALPVILRSTPMS